MNNEERILSALEALTSKVDALQTDLTAVKADVSEGRKEQTEMKKSVDAIFEQTAGLTEFKTAISKTVEDILVVTKENTFDITRMKAVP